MNRQQAIELAQKIKEIRQQKLKNKTLSFRTMLRLTELPIYEREATMVRLVEEGYADSVDDIRQMLKDKRLCLGMGYDSPTESTGMSDEVLDAGAHYLDINKELIDV